MPRDAATLILIDRAGRQPRILLGRRRADLAFLPGKYVFPGGRVDASDRLDAASSIPCWRGELRPDVAEKLLSRMRGRASLRRARALARAALRETHEETGLVVGGGVGGALQELSFVARAITPPGRVRRYDTRFFLADAASVTGGTLGGDGELTGLDWFTFGDARLLDLPSITRLVVEDVVQLSRSGGSSFSNDVPYYYHRNGRFQRDLL